MPAARLSIRRFRPADLKRILEIEIACFPEEPYSPELFLELHQECPSLFILASRARRIVAYMTTCVKEQSAEIVSLAVDPGRRSQGVGTALMRHTLEALRDSAVRAVDLTVRTANHAAIRFYRGFGFRYVRTIPRYYQDGGAGIRMRLALH
jgi:ribosomal-protein-alanine N-acetyltransferase